MFGGFEVRNYPRTPVPPYPRTSEFIQCINKSKNTVD